MKYVVKIKMLVVLILSMAFYFDSTAQKFYAQVGAKTVQVGQTFELAFVINVGGASDFTPPNFKDFEIAGGPNQSSSMQIVNGQMSQSITLSYLLMAKREGKLVIGPAYVNAGGQKLESATITIEVVKGNATQQAGSNTAANSANVKPDGSDIFIKTNVSKSKCYLGEQITISQKVYSRHQIIGFQKFNPPTYDSFWSQTIESTSGNQTAQENVEGVIYFTYELFRNVATPNKVGKVTIKPIEGEVVVRRQTSSKPRNIFEQFFGTNGYEDIAVKAISRLTSLEVMDLPSENRPSNFNGAVGNFGYKVEASRQSLKANDAFNLKITITGKGNVKLIDAPKLNLPESFETYEPKVIDGANSKVYDYIVVPREEGNFKLENLDFSYFDLDKKKYSNIPSPSINIEVLPPDPNSTGTQVYSAQNKVKETENDIRYIKKGDFSLTKTSEEFFNSSAHILFLVIPFGLLFIAILIRGNYVKANSNMAAVKERKAAKVAIKQLVKAEKLMLANKKDEFYTEILTSINNYLSHKLNIAIADVSKDSVKSILTQKGIEELKISKLIKTIENSEYAKYAPGAVSGNLKEVYEDTVSLISDIETDLNTKKA